MHHVSLAGGDHDHLERRFAEVPRLRVRCEQHGLAPGQHLRPAMGDLVLRLVECRERLRLASRRGDRDQAAPGARGDDDAAVGRPAGASAAFDLADRLGRSAGGGDLAQLGRRHEPDPLAVRREERVVGDADGPDAGSKLYGIRPVERAHHQGAGVFVAHHVGEPRAVRRKLDAGAEAEVEGALADRDGESKRRLVRCGPERSQGQRGHEPGGGQAEEHPRQQAAPARRRRSGPRAAPSPRGRPAARGSRRRRCGRRRSTAGAASGRAPGSAARAARPRPAARRAARSTPGRPSGPRRARPRRCRPRRPACPSAARRARRRTTRRPSAGRPSARAPAPGSCRRPCRGSCRPGFPCRRASATG